MNPALLSSNSYEWGTPQAFFDDLAREFGGFELDPCASAENHKCELYYTWRDDGLGMPWAPRRVFMNPPYGRGIGAWVEKACRESWAGAMAVCLLPARTDTAWWHDWVMRYSADIRYLRGRIRFEGGAHPAPFPSAIVVFQ